MPVGFSLNGAVAARRNNGLGAGSFNCFDLGVAVVPLVGDDGAGCNGLNQRSRLSDVRFLPASQDKAQWVSEGIDTGMDLGGQPTSRAADRLIATVFLGAPAECW